MARISYVNGSYMAHEDAMVPIEDRGFQFADAVYEVAAFFNRKLLDFDGHFTRLGRSLSELAIQNPLSEADCRGIFEGLINKNPISEGIIYLQITRGTAPRDHAFPDPQVSPNVVATAKALKMDATRKKLKNGVGVILVPENRWRRVDIKSTSLLGNVLAKEEAKKAGCYEAVFVDPDGFITEGTSSNAWIVSQKGTLKTRKAGAGILKGITRGAVLDELAEAGGGFVESSFSAGDAANAREFFLTSTTSLVMPVIKVDRKPVGDGKVGPVTRGVQDAYFDHIEEQTGYRVFD